MAKELYQLAQQDSQSVRLWVKTNPDKVVFYQEYTEATSGSAGTPLILCIQDPWQLQAMIQHGHNDAISFDATFGTNKFRVSNHVSSGNCSEFLRVDRPQECWETSNLEADFKRNM